MRLFEIDHFLHQCQIAGHISGRDVVKRLATAAPMVGMCIAAGFTKAALLAGLAVLLSEVVAYPLNKRASAFEKPLSLACGVLVFLVNWAAMFPFLAFAIILAHSDQLPFILAGYIWVFGIFVHVTNTFGLLPFYNWSQMTPAFGAVFLMLWIMANNPAFSTAKGYWALTTAIMVVYVVNSLDTMTRQKDTHRALERARREAQNRLTELERLTRIDPLTGLMNRSAFEVHLNNQMQNPKASRGVTVFMLDLDGFKPINDSYSHRAGDLVLQAVATRLRTLVGPNCRVARLGGDEFALVCPDIENSSEAMAMGTQMLEAILKPIPFDQKTLSIGASIGIAQQRPETANAADLLSGADQAMFSAKERLEQGAVIYDPDAFPPRPTLDDRRVLLAAMERGEIEPYYQPKVSTATSRIVGFEALSRWMHPDLGLMPPSFFLPMINELGLQGEFMIHTARCVLRDLDAMVAEGLNPGQMAINLPEVTLATISGRQDLFDVIEDYPHLRKHLTFEITEDIFIARSSEMIQQSISAFRKAGVRISLDDFGTGFASFLHLRELEFDELKLDVTFVQDLGVDPAATVLIDGLLTIGKGLGVSVVAEGVERREQLKLLRDMGCDVVQGFFFGQAAPIAETQIRLAAAQAAGGVISRLIDVQKRRDGAA